MVSTYNALVTGISGYVGFSLGTRLLTLGWQVRGLDIEHPAPLEGLEFIEGDVCDEKTVKQSIKGVDVVFHGAAEVPISRAGRRYFDVNVGGTRNVLTESVRAKVPHVVHISSSAVYGQPKSLPITEHTSFSPLGLYGWSKAMAEKVCQSFRSTGMRIAIIRPRTVVGTGRLGILSILFDWIHHGKPIPLIGSGTNRYQLVNIEDLVDACISAAIRQVNDDYNIGTERFSSVRAEIEQLISHARSPSRVVPINPWLARNILRMMSLLKLSPITEFHYKIADKSVYFDITKARHDLAWTPKKSNIDSLIEAYDSFVDNVAGKTSWHGGRHRRPIDQRALLLLRDLL